MNVAELARKANDVSGYMRLLGAPARLLMLCQLANEERSVGDLCALTGMKPPAVSQHLARLRHEGVVAARREGQTMQYSISDPSVSTIVRFLYETFCQEGAKAQGHAK